jgi:hypothetical protein
VSGPFGIKVAHATDDRSEMVQDDCQMLPLLLIYEPLLGVGSLLHLCYDICRTHDPSCELVLDARLVFFRHLLVWCGRLIGVE